MRRRLPPSAGPVRPLIHLHSHAQPVACALPSATATAMNDVLDTRNALEHRLAALHAGAVPVDSFMRDLLGEQVFMPVKDSSRGIANFHASQRAEPLSLTSEDGTEVLILFSSPERAKPFLDHFTGYEGGILEDMGWILEKMGGGYGISINPDSELGLDLDPDMVTQLAQLAAAARSN